MARVIYGDETVFDELIYGRRSDNLIDQLGQRLGRTTEVLTETGQRLMERAKSAYERFASHEVARAARRALRGVQTFLQSDEIMDLVSVLDLQLAKPKMQRFIMACPEVRTQYYEQRIDGFSESYVDRYAGKIGMDHYDYRVATDSMLMFDEEKETLSVTYYDQELASWDEPLSLSNQFDIQRTFAACRGAFLRKSQGEAVEDFTSRFGAML